LTRTDPLARAVFAVLVLACFAAFIVTQRLKHTPTAVQRFQLTPVFSPTPSGHIKEELISFKLAHAEKVTVTIIDPAGNTVATLVRNRSVARYKQFSLRWNGVTAGGKPAPAGEYRVRVSLHQQHRSVFSPRSFMLVRR
jgi:FlgD Ig-like domain